MAHTVELRDANAQKAVPSPNCFIEGKEHEYDDAEARSGEPDPSDVIVPFEG